MKTIPHRRISAVLSVIITVLEGGSKHSSDLAGTPLNLLQPKCSKCLCKTRLIEVRQLCQLAYKVCQEESQCLLCNTGTKSSLPNEIEKSW